MSGKETRPHLPPFSQATLPLSSAFSKGQLGLASSEEWLPRAAAPLFLTGKGIFRKLTLLFLPWVAEE